MYAYVLTCNTPGDTDTITYRDTSLHGFIYTYMHHTAFERSITIVRQGGREARGERRSHAVKKPRQSSLGVFLYRDRTPSTNY